MKFDINNLEELVETSKYKDEIISYMKKYDLNINSIKYLIQNITIYCDYDEVLADLVTPWVDNLNNINGTSHTTEDVSDFFWFSKQPNGLDFLQKDDVYSVVKPTEQASAFLSMLKTNNLLNNFYIVTATENNSVSSKEKHVLKYFSNYLSPPKIITNKYKYMMNYVNSVLIDDGAHNALDTVMKNPYARAVILNYKHNSELYTGKRIMRIDFLLEFFELLPIIVLRNYDRFFDPEQEHLRKESFIPQNID